MTLVMLDAGVYKLAPSAELSSSSLLCDSAYWYLGPLAGDDDEIEEE
jgi:hypothetical protein